MLLQIDVVPGMELQAKQYKDKPSKAEEGRNFLKLYDREGNCERTTNIHRQLRLVQENMLHYRDTVRLLKAWRHKEDYRISSYALELMVYRAATAKDAPKTGSPELLLSYVLKSNIAFLEADGKLQDLGANYEWADYLKTAGKVQLARRWKKLLAALVNQDIPLLRSFFPER